MSNEQRFDLPHDVVVRILIRLPVKPLLRFTCVSKQWRSVIKSDPKFAKSHLQLASQQRTLRRRFLISTYSLETPNRSLPPRFQSMEDNFNAASVKNLVFPSENNFQHVKASCNGLVFLCPSSFFYPTELFIWNPLTGFLRTIPSPSPRGGISFLSFGNYGFGHVSATDDYVIVFVLHAPHPSRGCVKVHVFSLTANSWKVVSAPPSSFPSRVGGHGTLSNGAFHWVGSRNDGGVPDPAIYAFDLVMEEFRQVSLPPIQVHDVTSVRTLVHFGGCLCLYFQNSYEHSEIWAMTEYGVPASWVKLFQLSELDLPDVFGSCHSWFPCYVMEGGIVVIKLLGKKELVVIECSKEEKPVCRGRYRAEAVPGGDFGFSVTGYDETLISVPE